MGQREMDVDNKVLKRIKEEQKEDSYYGKNTHGRSEDMDLFEAEFYVKRFVHSQVVNYERDEHCCEFTHPSLVKTLPEAVIQRLDNMEDLCFYGILSLDIHPLAWVSVDSSLCLWIPPLTLAHPPPTRIVHLKDYITAVTVIKSDPQKTIEMDGVPPYFLAVALRETIILMQLQLTETELVVSETGIEISIDSFVCKMISTDNGRLFVGCKDGCVYEIDCTQSGDMFGSYFYRRKTKCNKSLSLFSSPLSIFTKVRDVLVGAKPQEPVSFLTYDPSRQIILALTQLKSVGSGAPADGISNAHLHAFFLDSRGVKGEPSSQRKPLVYRGPFALLDERHISNMDSALKDNHMEEFIALHSIHQDECFRLNAVVVSSSGCRFYISVTEQDGFSCRAVRPPPPAEQGGWSMPGSKSSKITASSYQNGLWLTASSDKGRASCNLFCVSQDRNFPPRSLSTLQNQSPSRKAEVLSVFPASTLQVLPASVWSLQELPPTHWYCNSQGGSEGTGRILSTHELHEQHVVQHRKFLILCRNGIFLISRRQPWEKLENNLNRFSELVASPEKLSKSLRLPKEQICATAILWWVRNGASIEEGRFSSKNLLGETQSKSLQLFALCEKQEPGRAGLGLLIALSRFLRPVWSSGEFTAASDWARVACELDLVKKFIELSGTFEISSPKRGHDRQSEDQNIIRNFEVLEVVSHCQQLCALLHLVLKGGGSMASLHYGGLSNLIQSFYKSLNGRGADPILELVRSLSEASCKTGISKKARWTYDDHSGFREGLHLSRVEQEQLDIILTRLLPPCKLAQARADKELNKARSHFANGEMESVVESVYKARDQLVAISRDLTFDDLKRYAGSVSQDHSTASFRSVQQPLSFLQIMLHRFSNQTVASTEEVAMVFEFIHDVFNDINEISNSESLDSALLMIIQHNGLYRPSRTNLSVLDRTVGSAMQSFQGSRFASSISGPPSFVLNSEDQEERAMWPILRGMLEPHWKAYLDERDRSGGNSKLLSSEPENFATLQLWNRMVQLVGSKFVESSQLGVKALTEVETFLRASTTTAWLVDRGPKDYRRNYLAEWFLSGCLVGLLQAAGLFARAGQICYQRAKQGSDASLEDRIESIIEAQKAASFNGGQLPHAQVSVSSLEFEASLAQLQLQLRKSSRDPSAEDKYGRSLMAMGGLFEAACSEELFDIALDLCALSATYNEMAPTSVLQPLWRNLLLTARGDGNFEEVFIQQGRKFVKRDGFFPLSFIINLLEEEVLCSSRNEPFDAGAGLQSPHSVDAASLLAEIGVEPLRLVQAYVERLDGRLDGVAQRKCLNIICRLYVDILERALQSGQEGSLPVTSIENDFLRLETHPALRDCRQHLIPARILLDRVRGRMATTRG